MDLSAGTAILGLLLLLLLLLLLRRVQASSRQKSRTQGLHASSFHFIVSAYSVLALALILLFGHISQAFRVYVLVHGLRFCVRGVIIVL